MNYLQGFKKRLKSISKRYEFYCFYALRIGNKGVQDRFHDFDIRSIWNMVCPIYAIRKVCFAITWLKEWFYIINKIYHISNTPGTKFMKFGLKYSNLHFKKYKIIKFEPTWDWLEPSLESLQRIHVKYCGFL